MPALIRCDFGFRGFSSRDETFSSFISTTPNALGSGTSARAMTGPRTFPWNASSSERACHMRAHASDRMGRPEAFVLFLVCDGEIQGRPIPEPFPDPMPLPSDQDGELLDPRRAQRLEAVSQKRLAGHR